MKLLETIKKVVFWDSYCLLIILLGMLIYGGTLNYSFHFDDIDFIIINRSIRHFSQLTSIWQFWRIVTFFTFYLNYQIHRLDVVGYHVVNILIHFVNAFLVRWLMLLIMSTPSQKLRELNPYKERLALIAALLFICHPIQTQAVTYITQRFTSLAALFYLLALCFYLKARLIDDIRKSSSFFILTALCGVFAIFSKEIALTLPLMLILCELYFFTGEKSLWHVRKNKWPWICLIFLLAVSVATAVMFATQLKEFIVGPQRSGSHDGEFVTGFSYFLTQWRVLIVYIRLLFFPWPQNLDYDFPLSRSIFEHWTTWVSGITILAVLGTALSYRKRYPLLSFGIVWFFLALSIESSFLPIQEIIEEHRLYLPSVGFIFALTVVGWRLLNNERVFLKASAVIVCVLAVLSFQRNKVWHDELSLWSDVIKKSPHKARGYLNRGAKYSRINQFEKAIQDYNQVLAINPQQKDIYSNRGCAYLSLGQMNKALEDFNKSIELNPHDAVAYYNRGQLYQLQNRLDLAMADFNKSVEINPANPTVFVTRGELYKRNHQDDQALADFNQSLNIDPDNVFALLNRGQLYEVQEKYALALDDFNQVIKINPQNALAYHRRGLVHIALQEYDLALLDLNKLILMGPDSADNYHDRGSLYGMMQNYDLAIADYNRALSLNPKDASVHYNRAIVYASTGDLKKALADARDAQKLGYPNLESFIEMLEKQGDKPLNAVQQGQ